MQGSLRSLVDGEVMTLAGLVVSALDGQTIEEAKPQRADAAVAYDQHVTVARSQQIGQTSRDAALGVDGPLPAADALLRLREEGVRELLELLRGNEPERAAIIFTDAGANLEREAQMLGDDASRLDGLRFLAAHQASDRREPGLSEQGLGAASAFRAQAPLRHRDGGVNANLGMRQVAQHPLECAPSEVPSPPRITLSSERSVSRLHGRLAAPSDKLGPMTVVARRPLFRVLHQLLAAAILALSLPANAAVNQTGGGPIPVETGTSCNNNASVCINVNEEAEGGDGDIDAVETATISQETFNPLCELTFKVVARGASFKNTFGWYAIKRDDQGEPVAPELNELHVFLGCGDAVGTEKTLTLPKDVGEIGFFLANNGGACVATQEDPLGPTLTAQPDNLFFSQRAFNSDAKKLIHLLVWQGRANPNAFYFGWEDQNGGGDNDFEDLLTYVTGIQCASGGDPCEVEGAEGVCADGVMQCRDGALACVATQGESSEACNGLDDDCDGETDDGDDLCDKGEICVKGRCQPPCGTGEFRCDRGEMCVQGVCLETACASKECDEGEVCQNGECVAACAGVVCPYGATCRGGVCVDVCEGVECDAGFACEVREGESGAVVGVCSSCDCRGCGDGQSCVDHLCIENACKDQTCAEGTHCAGGECVDDCEGAKCPAGQICEAGGCVADPDAGNGNGSGGDGNGSGGDDGGIIIGPGQSGAGGSSNPNNNGQSGNGNYIEAKGCSCETPGTSRSSSAALALFGLLLGARAARARRKRG